MALTSAIGYDFTTSRAVKASVRPTDVGGFEAYVLENPRIRFLIVPQLGGRVWELLDKAIGRQWIWHRPDVPLLAAFPGDPYDDVWAGGWEELFPNDAPGDFEGQQLHDHGEWWTTGWTVDASSEGTEAVVHLTADKLIRGARCSKEFRLAGEGNAIEVLYRIENSSADAFHFLFKQHLPIAISESCRLVLPGGHITAVDPAFGTIVGGGGPFTWPFAEQVDLRVVPPPSTTARDFLYITGSPDSWCGVDDLAHGASLRLHYDARKVPYLWLFLSYGGWRNCYTAVLEPCTNMPKDLPTAVRLGQSALLGAGAVFETCVTVTLGALPSTV